MITADISDLEQQLDSYIEEIENKAEEAVRKFAYTAVQRLIRVSPYGDSKRFRNYYKRRNKKDGRYPLEEGMLRANWDISINGSPESIDFVSGSRQGEHALYDVYTKMLQYKLGDTFSFYNITPYIDNVTGNGDVAGKAEKALQDIYRVSNLNEYMR